MRNADDTTIASMKANADAQIDKLNQMVTQYHNAEKVATQLRAKGFETVKIDTGNNIDKFINSKFTCTNSVMNQHLHYNCNVRNEM